MYITKTMSAEVIQSSSNYLTYDGFLSKGRYMRVPLSNVASNSLAISLNSVNLGEFRISGNQVYNLGKSYIGYNYTSAAVAARYNVHYECGQDLFQWISFGDGSNVNLVDIQYADRYVKMLRSLRTTEDEFKALDRENANFPSGELASDNLLPFSRDGLAAGTLNSCTKDYTEVKYLKISPNVAQALTTNRLLPLACLKDTFLGMDKNIIFGKEMYLRFNTQQGTRLAFTTTNPSNPHVGAADIVSVPQYNNVYLYLYMETNEKLIEQVKSKVMGSGLKMSVPFQYGYRFSTQAGSTSSSIQISLTQQFGKKLKRIITSPFVGDSEISHDAFNHSNVNGTKVNTIRSSLDSTPLQDYTVNCFNPEESINPSTTWTFPTANGTTAGTISADDYREQRMALMGSAMPTYSEYQTNFFWQDIWGMNQTLKKDSQSVDDSDIDDGLLLTGNPKIYNMQFGNVFANDSTNDYGGENGIIAYYSFASFVRELVINKDGVRWM